MEFTLKVVCRITNLKPVFTDKTVYDLVYPIRSAPFTIAMPEYTWQPPECQQKLVYKLQTVGAVMPGIMTFDKGKREAHLSGSKEHYEERDKVFNFNLVVTTEDGLATNKDYSFAVMTLFKNSPPSFKGEIGELIAFVG